VVAGVSLAGLDAFVAVDTRGVVHADLEELVGGKGLKALLGRGAREV